MAFARLAKLWRGVRALVTHVLPAILMADARYREQQPCAHVGKHSLRMCHRLLVQYPSPPTRRPPPRSTSHGSRDRRRGSTPHPLNLLDSFHRRCDRFPQRGSGGMGQRRGGGSAPSSPADGGVPGRRLVSLLSSGRESQALYCRRLPFCSTFAHLFDAASFFFVPVSLAPRFCAFLLSLTRM